MSIDKSLKIILSHSIVALVCIVGSGISQIVADKGKYLPQINSLNQKVADSKPYLVRQIDLNGDEIKDVVVYSQNATNIFIQNSLGGYTPFENYQKDLRDNIEADNRLKSNQLEDSLKAIQTKAGEIRAIGDRR